MFFNKKRNTSNESNTSNKSEHSKVVLTKATESLDRHIVRLKKEGKADLTNHKARVFIAMDRSGSMENLYRSGEVQDVLTRLLPLASRFDDNGEMEVYLFHDRCIQMHSMNMSNYADYVNKELRSVGWGGTRYAPAIEKTMADYNDGSKYPAFGIFITDGDNFNEDKPATDSAIRKSSKYKIFYQFVGIGSAKFSYLQKLDDLDGRAVDNTGFIKVSDFSRLSDDELYEKLLEQYISWLKAMNI